MTTDCVYLYTAATVAINKNAVIGRAALNGLYCGLQVRLLEIGLPVSRTIRQITVTHNSDFIPAQWKLYLENGSVWYVGMSDVGCTL